ncbi:MAG: hypothetical protein EPN70_01205, partial [Paraburkholderia sp.]
MKNEGVPATGPVITDDISVSDSRRRSLLKAGFGATLLPIGGSVLLSACGGELGVPGAATQPPAQSPDQPPVQPDMPGLVSSFALAVLPDTQFYARYATLDENRQFTRKYGSEPFRAQTQWVASNAAALNIPFLIHLGDVVDQQNKEAQWMVAHSAMQVLESAKVPY